MLVIFSFLVWVLANECIQLEKIHQAVPYMFVISINKSLEMDPCIDLGIIILLCYSCFVLDCTIQWVRHPQDKSLSS